MGASLYALVPLSLRRGGGRHDVRYPLIEVEVTFHSTRLDPTLLGPTRLDLLWWALLTSIWSSI